MPSPAERASRSANGSSTPRSRASTAHATPASASDRSSMRRSQQQTPPTPAESSEDDPCPTCGGRGRDSGERQRHRRHAGSSPPPQVKQEQAHVKKEPASSKSRGSQRGAEDSTRTPKAKKPTQRENSPVQVLTDTDVDDPPPSAGRTSARRAARPRNTEAEIGTDTDNSLYQSAPPAPAWDESISNPPKSRTRDSSQTTQEYATAPDTPQQDGPAPSRHRRSPSSVSTSSSPPTGVSQYEDHEGRYSFHELRNVARKDKEKRDRAIAAVPKTKLEDVNLEDADSPLRARSSAKGKATVPQRTWTQPDFGASRRPSSPVTPTPQRLAKTHSMPASVLGSGARFSFTYKVCRGCNQPAPDPPLSAPLEESEYHCSRCFQPVANPGVPLAAGPSLLRKSTAHDATFKSRRPLPSDTSSDVGEDIFKVKTPPNDHAKSDARGTNHGVSNAGTVPNGHAKSDAQEDLWDTCGLSSALPRPSVFLDPRSPLRNSLSLPIGYLSMFTERVFSSLTIL